MEAERRHGPHLRRQLLEPGALVPGAAGAGPGGEVLSKGQNHPAGHPLRKNVGADVAGTAPGA